MKARYGLGLVWGVLLAAGIALAPAAFGQGYPNKPVKIIVPYPPGGPVDGFARGLADRLSTRWGQPVLLDARPGANEIIAAEALARSAPDGYTLLLATDASFTHNPFLFSKLPYDPVRDFVPVTRVVDINMALIVKGDLPANNVKEFVALMKKEGPQHNYGSAGNGNVTHLAFEAFRQTTGFEMTHVPYKGIAPAVQDLLNGGIDAMFAGSSAATPYLKSGKMKVLAISGGKRARTLPDVPTFTEAGYRDVEARFYLGLAAPKGTPPEVIKKIAADVRQAMIEPVFVERFLDAYGFEGVGSTPEEFESFLKRDRELSGRRIRAAAVRLD